MPHSFVSQLVHCIFATKNREPWITDDFRDRLCAYMGGIARNHRASALAIGAVADHVHILLSLPSTLSVSKAIQILKGNSSHWIHETFPDKSHFAWQEGYGAFSIGVSQVQKTKSYIANQENHHKTVGFEEEMEEIVRRHGLSQTGSRLSDRPEEP